MATNINFPIYGFINNVLALSEENWRRFFKPFITDSVQNGLATTAGANMTVYVSAGECRCGAVMGILDEMIAIDVSNGDSTYDRIDSIVVQYTYGEPSTLAVTIVQGTPSANPVPPTLTKVYDTLWQMEIAQILVPSGATSASSLTITDKRLIYESIQSIIDDTSGEDDTQHVWSAKKTHDEIVSLSTEIDNVSNNKANVIKRTVSGDLVTITDGADLPVESLSVNVEAVQDLHGYDNPWPAGGGKNKLPNTFSSSYSGLTYTSVSNGKVHVSGTVNATTWLSTSQTFTLTEMGLSVGDTIVGSSTIRLLAQFLDSNSAVLSSIDTNGTRTATIPSGTVGIRVYLYASNAIGVIGDTYNTDIWGQIELGSTATTWEPNANICPISGWSQANVTRTGVNQFICTNTPKSDANTTITKNANGTFTLTAISAGLGTKKIYGNIGLKYGINLKAGKTYLIRDVCLQINGVTQVQRDAWLYTASEGDYINYVWLYYSTAAFPAGTTKTIYPTIMEADSTSAPYVPYENTTLTIPLGQTVYGATLDVKAGALTVTHECVTIDSTYTVGANGTSSLTSRFIVTFPNKAYGFDNFISNQFIYATPDGIGHATGRIATNKIEFMLPVSVQQTEADGKAWFTANPTQVCYELATPITITGLTPAQMTTLLGYNAIWADCGAVDVSYRADTKLFLESQKTDAESYCDEQTTATREMITESIESTMTATKNYTTGQLVIANSTLLRATENIANGGTITIGTNVEEVDIESLIAEKTNTAVTTALQAEVTTNLELISSLARNQMSNYGAIAEIVKSGNASKVYKIGDQVMTTWNDGTTDLDLPWDIVAMRDVVNADGNTVPGMILQAHWALPGVQFDASEAAYVASAIIPAGTYYIEIGQDWGSNCKANYKYEFTTTQDVPVDGQIVITRSGNNQYTWGAPDQNPSTWVVYTFASNASITPIEGPLSLTEYTNGQTPSSTSLGTLLSSTKYSLNGINNLQRAGYGYNRWSNSAMRQWLNSDAVAGSWWTPKNPFDRQPQQLSSMRGFMAGLGSDFLSVVKPVTITTALNTISDSEIGTSETTIDTFFCASLEEEYCVPQLAGVEGAYWPYWKERLGLNSPQGSGADNANVNHIRYLISNHSSAQSVRLRSAGRGAASSTWGVGATGSVYGSAAATSYGSCPACVIC